MNKSHKISVVAIIIALMMLFTTAASFIAGCKSGHHYSEAWSYDESTHWHACTDDGCEEKSDEEEHTFDDGVTTSTGVVYTCQVCGYEDVRDIYSINVTNAGGTGISGVSISLRDAQSGSLIDLGFTGTNGARRYSDLPSATYIAYIDTSTIPTGYSLSNNQVTLTATDKRVTVVLDSAVITDQTLPSSKVYSVGDVAYDFTVETVNINGETKTFNLATALEEYGAVFLNLFYTSCNPCKAEVPYMEEAYTNLNGKVALVAFDYTGYGDTQTIMESFIADQGLSFDFTIDSENYYTHYTVGGNSYFPTTIVIDRYGIIAEIETGSNTSTTSWQNLFTYYTSDSYEPSYSSGRSDDTSSSQVESDVEMPSSEEISNAIVSSGSFTFSNYSEDGVVDTYNWPWVIGEDTIDGVSDYIQTSNQGVVGGYSIIVIDVSLKKGETILFDYYLSTEADYDVMYVQVDTVLQATYSGESSSWQTCLAYVAQYDGDYQLTLFYQKDTSKNIGDDTVYVSNLRIGSADDVTSDGTLSADLLYNAANNYTSEDIDLSAYGEGYGYLNYVEVYLASDGYYHVGSKSEGADPEDDPYLLADIYYGTPWYSTMSVWYEVYALGSDEINEKLAGCTQMGTVYDAFEDYAWVQNNCPWGYVPVNEELHDMLVAFVAEYGRTAEGSSLENQWLELCRYYVHYGAAHDGGDKCYSLDNVALTYGIRMADDLGTVVSTDNYDNDTALTFTVEVEMTLVPRGQYYSFTVDKSGVYRIYSYEFQTDADAAPYAFIMDANGNTLDSSTVDDLAGETGFTRTDYTADSVSYDFGMYVYLTAGETYFVGATFDSTEELGEFDVGIYYLGDELKYFATLTTGAVYTYYETTDADGNTTYTYYLPTRLSRTSFGINPADNCWYTLDENGNFDKLIYIDMVGSTWFNYYSSYTIETAISSNVMSWNAAELLKLKSWLAEAKANTGSIQGTNGLEYSLTGVIPAYADLVTYINELCNGGDETTSSTYADNAWMLTAYYVRIVSAN